MRFHLVTDNVTAGVKAFCNPSAYQTCEHKRKAPPLRVGLKLEKPIIVILLPDPSWSPLWSGSMSQLQIFLQDSLKHEQLL